MKKLFLVVFLFTSISGFSQNTYVPDDEFELALIELGYDSGVPDDYVPTANISAVTNLFIGNYYIHNYEGIQSFIALTDFYCYSAATSIDLTQNVNLRNLTIYALGLLSIDLTHNTELRELSFLVDTGIHTLDLSHNTALTKLSIESGNMLTNLNLTQNADLQELSLGYVGLTDLNLSQNSVLTKLSVAIPGLNNLDVAANTALTTIAVNIMALDALDLTHNIALADLTIENCSINNLNLSANVALQRLTLTYNNAMHSIDLTNNIALDTLSLNEMPLNTIDLSQNTALKTIFIYLTPLVALDITHNSLLTDLVLDTVTLTVLDVSQNSVMQGLFIKNTPIGSLDLSHNQSLLVLEADNIATTTVDLTQTISLSYAAFRNCTPLVGINFNNEDLPLYTLILDNVAIATIDLSYLNNITNIVFSDTQLSALDFRQNPNLSSLRLNHNSVLSTLDLRNEHNTGFLIPYNYLTLIDNPQLSCVLVDDAHASYMTHPFWHSEVDETLIHYASNELECILSAPEYANTLFTVFPNPIKSVLEINSVDQQIDKVVIMDLLDKNVMEVSDNPKQINVEHLQKGIYLLKIFSNGQTYMKKIIKQ
jgi:hypothetical protein